MILQRREYWVILRHCKSWNSNRFGMSYWLLHKLKQPILAEIQPIKSDFDRTVKELVKGNKGF